MAVFVTDGDQRSTLAVVRSLGRAGIEVVVGEERCKSLAGTSRYCTRKVCYPSPVQYPDGFCSFLREELQARPYEVLIPMTDITMQLVGTIGDLPLQARVPFPGKNLVEFVQDKGRILNLGRELGIPCPQSCSADQDTRIEDLAQSMRFPVVIKPRFSHLLRDGRWTHGPVQYALDLSCLIAKYHEIHAAIPFPLIQENIEGEGRGVFLLIWEGELKAAFCHRRLREKPPWGGVSVYSESLPLDRRLVDQSFGLLKAIGWQGVAMVEFKIDRRDQTPKLMEVNGRFWGSLQLAIDAGVDFPQMLHRCVRGENVRPQFEYKVGVKNRWLLGDLDHLLIRLRQARSPIGLKESLGSRFSACLRFAKPYERNLRYDVMRVGDAAPGWYEFRQYIGAMARRVLTRGRKGDLSPT